jgi:hypothetical protein
MSGSSKPLRADVDREREAVIGDIVYLVRRSRYEFVLTVPQGWPHGLDGGRVLFQAHFRDQHDGQGVTLDLAGLTDFYESLGQLMEYIHTAEKSQGGC